MKAGRVMHHLDLHQILQDLSELVCVDVVGNLVFLNSGAGFGSAVLRFLRKLRFCHIPRIPVPSACDSGKSGSVRSVSSSNPNQSGTELYVSVHVMAATCCQGGCLS